LRQNGEVCKLAKNDERNLKYRGLIISAILYFLFANTWLFWDKYIGIASVPAFMLAIGFFIIFAFIAAWHFTHASAEKFKNKPRVILLSVLSSVLIITYFQPVAWIYSKMPRDELLVASKEGAANCNTTFVLKSGHRFSETNVCFSITEVQGEYEQKGDTLLFKNVKLGRGVTEYYKFAVIKEKESPNKKLVGDFIRYRNFGDTTGDVLWITKKNL
jgi:hypothetical protein